MTATHEATDATGQTWQFPTERQAELAQDRFDTVAEALQTAVSEQVGVNVSTVNPRSARYIASQIPPINPHNESVRY